jgi:hypothetical protein
MAAFTESITVLHPSEEDRLSHHLKEILAAPQCANNAQQRLVLRFRRR